MHGFLFINENATAEKKERPVNQNVLVRFSIFFQITLFSEKYNHAHVYSLFKTYSPAKITVLFWIT